MVTYRPFRASPHKYEQNHRDSHQIVARAATLTPPQGGEEDGVVIALGERPVTVITTDAAFRLAKEIADILTTYRATSRG